MTGSQGTKRNLEARHIQMIAIGGTIGTGLFLSSSDVISNAGAVGAMVAYLIAGIAIFFVVSSLGEMATLIPCSGSFSTYASRFVDPALGFTLGWNYCLLWFIALPLEVMACAKFLQYWMPQVSQYILMAIILASLIIVNFLAVKAFGEIEYWLAMIKILAIIFFLCVSVVVLIRDKPGASRYYEAGGPFLGEPAGTAAVNVIEALIGACFSFGGTELVGITAGEARNPRKSVPKAINGTFWRIMIFYIFSIMFIGLLIPANSEKFRNADEIAASPFVIALKSAVLSAANSAIYASSRSLMALARDGKAPAFLIKTSASGVPVYGILLTVSVACVSFLGNLVGDGILFVWLMKLVALCDIVTWLFINLTHLRFRRAYLAQGYKLEDLPYRSRMYPYGCLFGVVMCISVIVLLPIFKAMKVYDKGAGAMAIEGFSQIITIPLYIALYAFWKIKYKTRLIPLAEVDLLTDNVTVNGQQLPEYDEAVLSPGSKNKFSTKMGRMLSKFR